MLKKIIAVVCLLVTCSIANAQVGGQRSYEFLNIPYSARVSGLGGVNVSLADVDINMAYNNPALTSDTLSGYLSFNYLSYFADIHSFSFIYQHDFGKYGAWFVGANHFDYGTIESFDDTGADLGELDAGETVIYLGRSHKAGNFTAGATLKFISSSITGYTSSAVAMDIGGVFMHPSRQLTAGLVFKNIGFVASEYTDSDAAKLPFDVQLGASFKPSHMPFRFSFTGYNLYQGDISYYDAAQMQAEDEPGTFDKIFRHIVVGAELLLTKNVNLRMGYNHLIRQELKLESTSGGAGFSFGLMFRVKAFEFAYSRGGYHAAGGSNNFTLTANTNLFFRKGKL
ncbi:type IX secretion system protein PorQ [Fulvivirga kasyanovii]|uniref:Type IX secretion system protein PorQ n=1 Tax=Fulvivirga kasyanovii TaxID=396812 RepID=A0ABW9RTL0_9BACT|nr:type IX secretion system protein PorQ [Fulvivirga kasyanovii]MTI27160.1 type IX secretion system protein PorQ [Fulvivirga kasyanovii]